MTSKIAGVGATPLVPMQPRGLIHTLWEADAGIRSEQWAGRFTDPPGAVGDPATLLATDQQHIFYSDANGGILTAFWDEDGMHFDRLVASPRGNQQKARDAQPCSPKANRITSIEAATEDHEAQHWRSYK